MLVQSCNVRFFGGAYDGQTLESKSAAPPFVLKGGRTAEAATEQLIDVSIRALRVEGRKKYVTGAVEGLNRFNPHPSC